MEFCRITKTHNHQCGSSQGLSDATQLSSTEPDIDMGPGIFTPEILEHDSNDDFLGKKEKNKVESMPPKKKPHSKSD
ncbi:hypothetical protein TNIN_467631 [Trichonephila inaurata madagascariensis]|uniref:Uncharacterized protein n=1 Tax=Trichonephila inaurata madagascariensis TaxID=2747483 RepID=A0A8X6WW67_9ARAC|nr:hypothetical protein TNIN_467631 [Trichonephila inaurata madagascariensis]